MKLRAAVIGLGKMGLSHHCIVNTHPQVTLTAVCDSSRYVLDLLAKYTGIKTYSSVDQLLSEQALDCVLVATPSRYHTDIVRAAIERGLHVFCEKPFALDPEEGYRLADAAEKRGLVNQVGYHYRFVATFNEAQRLLARGVLGQLHHVRIEAYGPVVLRPKGLSWRSQKSEGGGCLFDYACHGIDLVNYLVGRPSAVSGTVLNCVFSSNVEDEIYSTLQFSQGFHGQLATNWSDDSFRKMSLRVSIWGTNGRMNVDRQELQVYLRSLPENSDGLTLGWNVRYTTELTQPVWFYVRGEEYSAQIDHFVQCIGSGAPARSTFRTASDTMLVAAMMLQDAAKARTPVERAAATAINTPAPIPRRAKSLVAALFRR
jgi:scyllo-inositol 2-dehydrogenase (NADP+)